MDLRMAACVVAVWLAPGLVYAKSTPNAAAIDPGPPAFTLRLPEPVTYRIEAGAGPGAVAVEAWSESGQHPSLWFGPRVVLQVEAGVDWHQLVAGRPLSWIRSVSSDLHLLEAGDAWTALTESVVLGATPGVILCRPVMRQRLQLHRTLASPRNDPRFTALWHLENRRADGSRLGPDLNARAAWSTTRGEGVVVAVVDDGVDLAHPEFERAAAGPYHFNFTNGTTNGMPTGSGDYHGTLVAGFALARDNNREGIAGMAPRASLASWKIFNGNNLPTGFDDQLMDMFQYLPDVVAVQNHSWGNADAPPLGPSSLEQIGISNAVTYGRGGRGVVMVRSAGNGRQSGYNANDDGYANDPRVITVGAVNSLGRAADYSSPGACLLVSAFGGGADRALTSTDRLGAAGNSSWAGGSNNADYWTSTELRGTSFSAPQVSGLVALLLAINPALTIRDVQHILILAARQLQESDPDLLTNFAGFRHSHNTGFGVPDAARAVVLARDWIPRPPLVEHRRVSSGVRAIPDDGLRVVVRGDAGPEGLLSAPATPALGPLVDGTAAALPLVDVGFATNDLTADLHGKVALIQRGPIGSFPDDRNTFRRKLERAAAAGAAWALVYNDRDLTERVIMGETDFVPIPAVMINQIEGETIRDLLGLDPAIAASIELNRATATFAVSEAIACEHVGLRVDLSHARRGDLQIILHAPTGTRSILQRTNFDTRSSPSHWTFWTTRHFGEPAAGTWIAEITDTAAGTTGTVTRMELILRGVEMIDLDADGLDDRWEMAWFGSLEFGPRDNPDGDLWPNAHEQWMGSDPTRPAGLAVGIGQLTGDLGLLFWDATMGGTYEVSAATGAAGPFESLGTVTAERPDMEWILPLSPEHRYFHLLRR